MSLVVLTPKRSESRYSLTGAMSAELSDALRQAGCFVNPSRPRASCPVLFLWFNFLPEDPNLWDRLKQMAGRARLLQFYVDHPLALASAQVDRVASQSSFALALVCLDGPHLLRLRWPKLTHVHCLHGVPPSALCDKQVLEASHLGRCPSPGWRGESLVVLGSIHGHGELDALWEMLPPELRRVSRQMVQLLGENSWMPFEQALDVCVGAEQIIPGDWALAAGLFRVVTATLNRLRRVALVQAMQGIPAVVYGSVAWREFCTGSLRYGGEVRYADVPAVLSRSRACLAWGPTQFTHCFSERILLFMAAGCATVADDRLLVRRHFVDRRADGSCIRLFDAARPESARVAVESVLNDREDTVAMAMRARQTIEQKHLWCHRLDTLLGGGAHSVAA